MFKSRTVVNIRVEEEDVGDVPGGRVHRKASKASVRGNADDVLQLKRTAGIVVNSCDDHSRGHIGQSLVRSRQLATLQISVGSASCACVLEKCDGIEDTDDDLCDAPSYCHVIEVHPLWSRSRCHFTTDRRTKGCVKLSRSSENQ
jgi:hypothetical protein